MSDRDDADDEKAQAGDGPTGDPPNAPYEVGYGKPPKQHRFKPGQSGNRQGRPRGSRSFKTDLREVIEQKIPVTENGRKIKVTVRQAMLMRLRQQALAGDRHAMDRLLKLAVDHLPDEVVRDDRTAAAEDARLLDELVAELRRETTGDGSDG